MVQVQFGHLWNSVEVNYEILVQTHLEFQCQVEIEQDLVEVEDRFGLEFLVRTEVSFVVLEFVGLGLLVQIQIK